MTTVGDLLEQRLKHPYVEAPQARQAVLCSRCGETIDTVVIKAETMGGTPVNVILPFGDNFQPDLPFGLKTPPDQEVPIQCDACGLVVGLIDLKNEFTERVNRVGNLEGYYR